MAGGRRSRRPPVVVFGKLVSMSDAAGQSEMREFTRIGTALQVTIAVGPRTVTGRTHDVALKGAFVTTAETLAVGTECRVAIHLEGTDARIEAEGHVVRVATDGLALEFTALVGPDSYTHLRNLVTLNATDTERVETEFSSHSGLRRR